MTAAASEHRTLLRGGLMLGADGAFEDRWLLMSPRGITAVGHGSEPEADAVIDVGGDLLTPGLIDLHCHGGGGHAFDDGARALADGLAAHRAAGTTRSMISLVSASADRTLALLREVAALAEADPLVLGAHLEGPYLAVERRGAHAASALRTPDPDEVAAMLSAARGALRVVTIAPELPGALAVIGLLRDHGVIAAIGHSNCDAALAGRAVEAGAGLVTHLFNAMPPLHHREPGPVGVALADPALVVELIADGVHLAPEVIRLAFSSAAGRVALVSDAMAAAAAGDGCFRLGDLRVTVREGVATVDGTATIAGSTATLASAVRHCVVRAGIPPVAAIAAATSVPARLLGIGDRFGRLARGYAADVVRWGSDWRVRAVWADAQPLGGRRAGERLPTRP